MNRFLFPLFFLFLLLAAAPLATLHADETPARKPNILIILADDLGYGEWQLPSTHPP